MSSDQNHAGLRPPLNPNGSSDRTHTINSARSNSSLSTASNDSQSAAQLAVMRNNNQQHQQHQQHQQQQHAYRPQATLGPASQANFSRPAPRGSLEEPLRNQRSFPAQSNMASSIGHRPRQHSQGFFEPSLPTTSASNLSASAIAAAAAMSQLGPPSMSLNDRKKSMPNLSINVNRRPTSPAIGPTSPPQNSIQSFLSSVAEGHRHAATTAANAAYPKSAGASSTSTLPHDSPHIAQVAPPMPDKEKAKEKSKMKLFSKPKAINLAKDKDVDKRLPTLPSPGKRVPPGLQSGYLNASTTSLAETLGTSAASLYSSANTSTSTLVPFVNASTTALDKEKDKDKHRPYFLSRQKHKSDKTLPLSSASSNSQAVDPSAPSSLYSFTPQSPGLNSTFSKSMTGLDLRHGGKGLRDRRKEEKAAASLGLTMASSSMNLNADYRNDFVGPSSLESTAFLGSPALNQHNVFSFDPNPTASAAAFNSLGNNMGLSGITPDDAWPLLKARLLNVFEGETLRTPVEDYNLLVSVHIRRCVQKRSPHVLVEDLREFLLTGFSSLAQTLKTLPDDRLIPNLVEMWQMVYCTVLPFIQAVFLPLDLEFRGHGTIMTNREAADFWSAMPDHVARDDKLGSGTGPTKTTPGFSEELDVRRMTLVSFRDTVLMPRHESLLQIFSRLSLDSINAAPSDSLINRSHGASAADHGSSRPTTATGSLSPRLSSYSSQTSTLLDSAANTSQGSPKHPSHRSRAASNTSAGSFGSSLPHIPSPMQPPPPPQQPAGLSTLSSAAHSRTRSAISVPEPAATASLLASPPAPHGWANSSAQVTRTVARMLQCVSILAGCRISGGSGGWDDAAQAMVDRLVLEIKRNWLARGRTGRQRMGFVGGKTLVRSAA